jgi:hypothetical protein
MDRARHLSCPEHYVFASLKRYFQSTKFPKAMPEKSWRTWKAVAASAECDAMRAPDAVAAARLQNCRRAAVRIAKPGRYRWLAGESKKLLNL